MVIALIASGAIVWHSQVFLMARRQLALTQLPNNGTSIKQAAMKGCVSLTLTMGVIIKAWKAGSGMNLQNDVTCNKMIRSVPPSSGRRH